MNIVSFIVRALFGKPKRTPRRRSDSRKQSPKGYPRRTTIVTKHITIASTEARVIEGPCHVIDGDTIVIGKTRIRLFGIDAPELDHPWGNKAKWAVIHMCKGKTVTAHLDGSLSHDRVVATCFLPDGRDIGAELVKLGLAIDWPKFSGGRYRKLEAADARKRHWRAHQRQLGRAPKSGT